MVETVLIAKAATNMNQKKKMLFQTEIENQQKYERTKMQCEQVMQKLKEKGYRITKQRMVLIEVILKENCSTCKEIYYIASKIDPQIGAATVYRMVNILEEIGAISRRNMYKIDCLENENDKTYTIEFDDHTMQQMSEKKLNSVLQAGLKACGYIEGQHVKSLIKTPDPAY